MASSSWDEDGEDSEPLSPESVAGSEDTAQEGSGRGGRGFMSGIRHSAAKKLRQLAENTAAHISRWAWGRATRRAVLCCAGIILRSRAAGMQRG
jgi:hypothetical protein